MLFYDVKYIKKNYLIKKFLIIGILNYKLLEYIRVYLLKFRRKFYNFEFILFPNVIKKFIKDRKLLLLDEKERFNATLKN